MEAGSSGDGIPPFPINPTWLLSKETLMKIPSILDGIKPQEELKFRQQAASFMQEMGELLINGVKEHRVKMSFCMCVAMIHLHRFFVVHSMRIFDPRDVAAACLFLAGKSEEFPRKLELISKAWYKLKHRNEERARPFDKTVCEESGEFIVFLEGVVLQTIGFKLDVQLPHPLIVRYTQKYLREKVNLNETAYFFATDMIFITNWCVRYRIATLACVCIHLTCLWAEHEISQPPGAQPWYKEIDPELTKEVLDVLVEKFTRIYETTDQNQLISRKRMAERQNRMIASSSKYRPAASSSSSTAPGSSHKPSVTGPALLANGGEIRNSNNKNNASSSDGPTTSVPVASTSRPVERPPLDNKLGILPPPPVPPQLSSVKVENAEKKPVNLKREFVETKLEVVDNRGTDMAKRKLTVKEYRERNASSSSSTSTPTSNSSVRAQNAAAPPVTNGTSWMNGA